VHFLPAFNAADNYNVTGQPPLPPRDRWRLD